MHSLKTDVVLFSRRRTRVISRSEIVSISFAYICLHLHMGICFDQDSMSCLAFALVSPPSASATMDLRGVPRIGHFGTTHLYGFKKFKGPSSPRLGWSAMFEDEGTRATHSMLASSQGSSRSSNNFRHSTCSDVPLTNTSKAGQLSTKAISLLIEKHLRQ